MSPEGVPSGILSIAKIYKPVSDKFSSLALLKESFGLFSANITVASAGTISRSLFLLFNILISLSDR